ncbi:pyridoxal phosphate-dependent aminotransferase [Lachnobacterium bovis]|uniref:Aminotransferase class I and II n=1 Tax=Lachnobacterium bovis TaxID=140626 RepID=A0A1H9Q9F1_9FIRM|nr:aminotransferase class I/II-fold pyridoxal phosphate-dependent enzyme [Lachnobacterium bovis]SER57186.1 Aminotransferase class I and II [Lachnobacterium bovis]
MIHGGDIYRNNVEHDFSVNINFVDVPKEINEAIINSIPKIKEYPDIECQKLRKNLSIQYGCDYRRILCGNGASDIFMAIAHGIKPNKALLLAPSFYGYIHCLDAVGCKIDWYNLKKENNFCIDANFVNKLKKSDCDLLFLTNPNNPTGQTIDLDVLDEIIGVCQKANKILVIDECFSYFLTNEDEYCDFINSHNYEGLIRVRAYTKIFAIPGIRLGYGIFYSDKIVELVKRNLSEWNVSTFAQEVGNEACKQKEYIVKTRKLIETNKNYLIQGLLNVKNKSSKLSDLEIVPSEANFILIYTKFDLYKFLLEKNILIRDCSNFKGLKKGYYRIAVKSKEEIDILLSALMLA